VKESKKEQKEKEAEKPKVQFVLEKCEVPVTGAADVVGIEFTRDVSNYRLIAFVVHLGDTLEEGHYVAYVQANGHWYKVNDDVVTEDAPEWQQMAEIGYLYLYEKVA
jgi:ubiquitin C-terminal hydrolase